MYVFETISFVSEQCRELLIKSRDTIYKKGIRKEEVLLPPFKQRSSFIWHNLAQFLFSG